MIKTFEIIFFPRTVYAFGLVNVGFMGVVTNKTYVKNALGVEFYSKQFNKYKAFCEECCFSKLLDCFADVVAKAYSVNNDGEGNSFEKLEGLYNSILSNERWKKVSGDTHNRLLDKKDIKELRERKNYTSTKKYMTQVAEIIDAREYFYDSNNKPRDFIIERGGKHSSDIKCIYLLPISKQYGDMHNAMHKKDANYINEGNKEDYSNGPLMYIGLGVEFYSKQAVAGVQAGASVWVHTFNGMSGMTHQEPGMVGAILNTPNTYAELICDGHHVRPEAAEIVMKMKGADHVVLITDSMRAAGLPDGPYMLGEYEVEVRDGAAWLPTGRPAASILTLKTAVKNVIDWGIATPAEAIMMASLTPAKSVNIDDVCGQIKPGLSADFIVLDNDFDLVATYLDGEKRYEA